MQAETITRHADATDDMMPHRVRLSRRDVAAVRKLALRESYRQGVEISWCDLMRSALKKMAEEGVAIG